jgi:hypothetical protein
MPVTILLAKAAEALGSALIGKAVDEAYARLKGGSAQRAYRLAVGAAVRSYATGDRLALARPLISADGLLGRPEFTRELAQLVTFDRDPDLRLLGRLWAEAAPELARSHDLAHEAGVLVSHLEAELRKSDAFRPVIETRSLGALADGTDALQPALAAVERQLDDLNDLLGGRFGDLVASFSAAAPTIQSQIHNSADLIADKTAGFVGRGWVFDAVEQFMQRHPRGYFVLSGEPGIGKSALAAQMVKSGGGPHHFNVRAEGISTVRAFLTNVCAQLVATYGLPYGSLPPHAGADSAFLSHLLAEAAQQFAPGVRCVVVVDALDEAAPSDTVGENPLCLPLTLPERVFVLVTTRGTKRERGEDSFRADCEKGALYIDADSAPNMADVTDYVRSATARFGIRSYLATHGLTAAEFVELLVAKSEGNFMYLRHVLPQVEDGAYHDRDLRGIPSGLRDYYEDHWRRMRGRDEAGWFSHKLPVIMALTVAREPLSIDQLCVYARIARRAQVRAVLREWAPFLEEHATAAAGPPETRYRLYHSSFFDFVAAKQEVADERVDLSAAHGKIADAMWADLGGTP